MSEHAPRQMQLWLARPKVEQERASADDLEYEDGQPL
jgi:hypothetical protein